ncbi:MAG: DUF2125 domain-containing protein [Roseovarius sp.]
MSKIHSTSASIAALSIFMTGTAAFADVSSQDVWDDWKSYMTGFGYTVEGEETTSGADVMVKDVTMSMSMPDGAGDFAIQMPELSFTDNGDGTVSVSIPPVMPMMMTMNAPDAENVEMNIDYITDGFNMTVSGDMNDMLYEYNAVSLSVSLGKLVVDGTPIEVGAAMLSMADVTGSTAMKVGNLRMSDQSLTAGPVKYDLDFVDPDSGASFKMVGNYETMGFNGKGSFPTEMNPDDMAAMLKAGFGFDGGFTYTGGSQTLNAEEGGSPIQGSSSSDSGNLQVAMDEGRLAYSAVSNNMKVMMVGGDIPFPIELALQKGAFNLSMPISKDDGEQDFAFGFEMGDFTMSDMIWGMVDPAQALPRDPATLAIDLTGKAKLLFDIMDPTQMEAVDRGETMPGELNEVTLNALTVRAAGAELTGEGAFTFDNSDLETFDGMPAPDGSVDLALSGGNGLLDKLVGMGLLPEEQAMGARMMMGLFAVPGAGEDSLTSKIEVKSDGQILANGQRLK